MNANLIRSAIHVAAVSGMYLATAMLVPALVDLYYRDDHWRVFAVSAFMTGGLSLMTATATRGAPPVFSKRFGFIVVNVLWVVFSIAGALPIYFSGLGISLGRSLFESVSAVTTTGATAISGLDHMPKGLLMWRSLLHWLGGIGILALGLFVLPFLRVGGMSFFKLESSDSASDRPFARLASFTRAFVAIYAGITIACAVAFDFAGMTRFDAINHAMGVVSTGGFSTHDASFGYYGENWAILWIATFFMIVGSLPFSLLILFAVRRRFQTLHDPQVLVFLGYVAAFSVAVAIYHHFHNDVSFGRALTHAVFNFTSILSTSGYASQDYTQWGPFVVMAAFAATFMGGCSGSTAGGIKAYRFLILFKMIHIGLKRLVYPDAVYSLRYGRITVDADMQKTVLIFISTFMLIWALGAMGMGALGYDLVTALSASATTIANAGVGIGPVIGPAGNFSSMNEPAFYLLSILMLLGRLEVLSVLVLLLPTFWRN